LLEEHLHCMHSLSPPERVHAHGRSLPRPARGARYAQWRSLITGTPPGFDAARRLDEALGFTDCGPFEDDREDPNSAFMTRTFD